MKLSDISVEVRDRNLQRVGTITSQWLDFQARIVHNGVGEWELTLPASHPMAEVLFTPGSGIVVSLYGEEKMSGPVTQPERTTDQKNPDGSYTFRGVTDDILLADALAFPEPSNADATSQTVTNDVRSGDAETLMREYVAANIANNAPTGRLGGFRDLLQVEPTNQNRGPTLTKSPRFQNLGELLGEIAVLANLGFHIVQRGNVLQFEVLTIADRSDLVRLDVRNGTMTKETLAVSPPKVTRTVVAGQGEGVDRVFVTRTTTESLAAEEEWGRPIEHFIDQRNASELVELEQAGDKSLLEYGFTATAVKAIPSDDQTMLYGVDWEVGDTVGLVSFGQETTAKATAAVIIANKSTVAVGASIGDITGFDATLAETKRVEDTVRRVDALERATVAGGGGGGGGNSHVTISDIPPENPHNNALWIDSETGTLYFYYDDGDSSQWVELQTGSGSDASISTRVSTAESNINLLDSRAEALESVDNSLDARLDVIETNYVQKSGANWAISNATAVTVSSTTPTIIAQLTLTTNGRPVFLCGTGDMNPMGGPTWNNIQLFRGSTAIGKFIINESTANSVNTPFAITFIDTPPSGSQTYSIRAWRGGANSALYGEGGNGQAPQLVAFELY